MIEIDYKISAAKTGTIQLNQERSNADIERLATHGVLIVDEEGGDVFIAPHRIWEIRRIKNVTANNDK